MRTSPHWLEEYSKILSVDILRTLALRHAELGGEVGATIAYAVRRADLASLCDVELNYEDPRFKNVEEIRHCRQATAFFSKLEDLDIGQDKEQNALTKWFEAESHCCETNALFKARARGEFQFTSRVEDVIQRARRKIALVLGEIPKLADLQYRFGPGATTATRKKDANPREKLQAGVQCSEDLFPVARYLLEEMPMLADLHACVERVDEDGETWLSVPIDIVYGRLDFAAKNAKTKRITVVEPMLNSMYQLAIGDHLTRRLAAFGLDLKDQGVNRALAFDASLTGALATLDLKSASDTVATELVFGLLPLDWAIFLARGRSSHITLPSGDVVKQEKFSSMGNGFTFPLESLIFWALTVSACQPGDTVSVYGDDIICPTVAVPQVIEVLTAVGFWVNKEKSYWTGPFRESCGVDFYRGSNVRPFYQKTWVSARTLFLLHNFYVRKGLPEFCDLVLSWIHPALVIWGPDGYGDGHLLGDHTPIKKTSHRACGFAGYIFSTYSVKPRRDTRPNQRGDFVLPQYSVYRRGSTLLVDSVALIVAGKLRASRRTSTGYLTAAEWNGLIEEPSQEIPEFTLSEEDAQVSGVTKQKAVSLPGDDGYKMISIYTLGG